MKISFRTKSLLRSANDDKFCLKKYGTIRSKKIKLRLTQLSSATTLEDVRHLPGNYHELIEDRKGQWACDLDNPYRLIFIPHENPIPITEDGVYIWAEIRGVEIIEIIDYHK